MKGFDEKKFITDKMIENALRDLVSSEVFDEVMQCAKDVNLFGLPKTQRCADNIYYKKAFKELGNIREVRRDRILSTKNL